VAAGVFRFSTDRFDAVPERENPHNGIRGEALLLWLRDRLAPDLDLAPPDPDDWGWYATLRCEGRAYTVGASGADKDEEGRRAAVTEWTVQVEKHRTLGRSCSGAPGWTPPIRASAASRRCWSASQASPAFPRIFEKKRRVSAAAGSPLRGSGCSGRGPWRNPPCSSARPR
jgi:hypothetical protein